MNQKAAETFLTGPDIPVGPKIRLNDVLVFCSNPAVWLSGLSALELKPGDHKLKFHSLPTTIIS